MKALYGAKDAQENKCQSYLPEWQEGGSRQLQGGKPCHNSWESDGATNPGSHFQTHEGQNGDQEQSAWNYKGEIVLNQPDSFYNEMASLVDEGRVIDVVYLNFSKAFDTVSHNILIDKLMEVWAR